MGNVKLFIEMCTVLLQHRSSVYEFFFNHTVFVTQIWKQGLYVCMYIRMYVLMCVRFCNLLHVPLLVVILHTFYNIYSHNA
jgi:hypothetical protein